MDITIYPQKLHGKVCAIPSKSQAHRYLICASFADKPTEIFCHASSRDIETTADCLRSLGAKIERTPSGYYVCPTLDVPPNATLNCRESGSTLRFLLPLVGALGIDVSFSLEGRLSQRPLAPLWEEMERKGCSLRWIDEHTLHCSGQLQGGEYRIVGNISSQFITGLLFACALIPCKNKVSVIGNLESRPYVDMTFRALADFGIHSQDGSIFGGYFKSPGKITVEGDWSNSAYFFAANALGSQIQITGLDINSAQGDKTILQLLAQTERHCVIDAANIPDLVPILAVVSAAKSGAVLENTRRLRMKESNRIESVIDMLKSIGGCAEATENTLTVYPCSFHSGAVNAYNDHRIAMAAAIAATAADGPVTITGAECIEKSYPEFWNDYRKLGGAYEQHIR